MCIYIYIYVERERERDIIYIYIYIYTHTCIYRWPTRGDRGLSGEGAAWGPGTCGPTRELKCRTAMGKSMAMR